MAKKRIQLHGDLNTVPVIKTGSVVMGVSLASAPTSNVTVTFDSVNDYFTHTASLTFTTSNWATPQTITITGVNDVSTFGLRKDTLTVVASGGGYDGVSGSYNVNVYDSGLDKKFLTGFRWINEISINSGNRAAKRQAFRDRIFPSGYPSNASPSAITVGYTGSQVHNMLRVNLTGYSSIDRLTYTRLDGQGYTWTHIVYHFKQASPVGLFIIHSGHGSEGGTTAEDMTNRTLSEGYDVLVCAMPISTGCENTENNPNVSSAGSGTANHNTILSGGLDSASYLPLQLFFFSTIEALNYLDQNYSYSDYYAAGLSGGGWSVTLLAALDYQRIAKAFCVRGMKPRSFNVTPEIVFPADYESGAAVSNSGLRVYQVFTDFPYMDIFLMTNAYYLITHPNDPEVTVGGYSHKIWKEKLQQRAAQVGSSYELFLNTEAGETAHAYQPTERDYIFTQVP